MRYLSVCSGIEAASVAWKGLGWTPVAFSEVEPFPCTVLTKRFPDVPNVGDMTRIDGRKFRGTVDLLVGGTPCQGFSVAGKRGGLSDIRSGLAMHFVRLVSEIKPGWIVWENVPGAFSTASGRDFGAFVRALDECGYHFAWRVLDAQYFGVPQRRRRIFLVGHSADWRHPAAVLFEPGCLRRDTPTGGKKRQDVTWALTGCLGAGGADDNRAQAGFYIPGVVSREQGSENDDRKCASLTTRPYADNDAQESRLVISCPGVRRLTPLECERLQGFPDGWTDVLHEGRPASDSARYKALGNSMAVPVMRWIGERIQRVEDGWDVV